MSPYIHQRGDQPEMPPVWRMVGISRRRPVSILCTYAWWPTSYTILSSGAPKTCSSAVVSSTTPSDEPRCPPVCHSHSHSLAGRATQGSRVLTRSSRHNTLPQTVWNVQHKAKKLREALTGITGLALRHSCTEAATEVHEGVREQRVQSRLC